VTAPSPTPEPVTITFAYATPNARRAYYEALIEQFNERYPHITVDLREWYGNPWDTSGANDADVIVANGSVIRRLREQERIVGLGAFVENDESFDLSDLHPSSVAYLSYEGEAWSIPAGMDVNVMYYNPDLFDQYGVPYPEYGWTWVDFVEKAVALRDPGAGVYGYAAASQSFDTLAFIYQHGGRIVDDLHDPTRVMFDDPLTVEALEWYAGLAHDHDVLLTPERARRDFDADIPLLGIIVGKVGMWMDALSGTREVQLSVNYGMVPLPRDARSFTQAMIYGYAITAQALEPEACWQWIAFLSEQVPQGLIPARTSVLESEAYEQAVGRDVAGVAAASLEGAEFVSYWALFTGFPSEMRALDRAIDRIIRGDATAWEALEQAQRVGDE
jgi:multiple sugar transport system substrate-binding protein